MWHMTCDMWHVTCDMWHVTCDPQGPTWALSGGVERGTNERPGIWSCDLWRRPLQCKEMSSLQETYRHADVHTYTHTDMATLWLNRPSGSIQWKSSSQQINKFLLTNSHTVPIKSTDRYWKSHLKLLTNPNAASHKSMCSFGHILIQLVTNAASFKSIWSLLQIHTHIFASI